MGVAVGLQLGVAVGEADGFAQLPPALLEEPARLSAALAPHVAQGATIAVGPARALLRALPGKIVVDVTATNRSVVIPPVNNDAQSASTCSTDEMPKLPPWSCPPPISTTKSCEKSNRDGS